MFVDHLNGLQVYSGLILKVNGGEPANLQSWFNLPSAATPKAAYAIGALATLGQKAGVEGNDAIRTLETVNELIVEGHEVKRLSKFVSVGTFVELTVARQINEVVTTTDA